MFKNLKIHKPIAFIDVETTGLRPKLDRIIELSILKVFPDGVYEYKNHRINPEVPIPVDATAIHGITDKDVVHEKPFREYAKSIRDYLEDCDLAGFNIVKFDLPFLEAELKRSGVLFSRQNRKIVDVQILYHLLEPRDLKSAYLRYCGKELKKAHTAEGDATAAAEILDKQLECYIHLPRSVSGLHEICCAISKNYVDPEGKFIWENGEVICNFGKRYYGWPLEKISLEAPDFLQWILKSDFTPEVKGLVSDALRGKFPHQENK